MGVYIDMEMPTDGSCIQIVIDDDGKVYPDIEKCIMKMGSIAKALPVPPHGRLIDQDAILREIIHGDYPNQWIDKNELLRLFRNAPAVIEAEEGE